MKTLLNNKINKIFIMIIVFLMCALFAGFADEAIYIDTNGNVGIGTTSPNYTLDVNGNINFTGTLYQNGNPYGGGSSAWSTSGANIYYNNGNVGIGTENPGYKLHVVDANNTYSAILSYSGDEGNIAGQYLGFGNGAGSYFPKAGIFVKAEGGYWRNDLYFAVNTSADGSIVSTSDSKMMIDGVSGNVGIGTNSPISKLQVDGSITFGDGSYYIKHTETASHYTELFNNDTDTGWYWNDTYDYLAFLRNGTNLLQLDGNVKLRNGIYIGGHSNTQHLDDSSHGSSSTPLYIGNKVIVVEDSSPSLSGLNVSGNVGIGTTNPSHKLYITGDAKVQGSLEVMRSANQLRLKYLGGTYPQVYFNVNSAGNLGIMPGGGTGSVGIGTTSPAHPLHMGSGAYCSSGGTWTNASSIDYKENIKCLKTKDAINALSQLKPVKFRYKNEKNEEYLGFIAEDVPELVATNDKKGLASMDIVAVLTKVVQEQQKEIESLKSEFSLLAGKDIEEKNLLDKIIDVFK